MLRPGQLWRPLPAALARLPRRCASTASPSRPAFPCVDANESREANLLASKQATQPAAAAGPSFPCVDANETRAARLLAARRAQPLDRASRTLGSFASSARRRTEDGDDSGPEPNYDPPKGYSVYHHPHLFPLDYGSSLPSLDIAYETWGALNPQKDNAILLHTGLSASSHARSHPGNPSPGWWESFLGPGPSYPIDTSRFFVICTNVLGGCYGSTGPSSPDPTDPSGAPYATRFPIVSIWDMVRAQFKLLDHLGVDKLYASAGSSMGGMQSIAAAWLEPKRVGRVVSISGSARSGPSSIALRYAQRSVLMADPNWNRGFYYDSLPPHTGMKLARQIATITYRSGPEWEQRFARRRMGQPDPDAVAGGTSNGNRTGAETPVVPPVLCPDFLIETYLDHQGEQFCLKYDANSLLYVSKAMDLFDMTTEAIEELFVHRSGGSSPSPTSPACAFTPLAKPSAKPHVSSLPGTSAAYLPSLSASLSKLASTPTLVLGAQSDVLFPIEQQRELAEALRRGGNRQVVYYELDSPFGHDTFLIDLAGVGGAIRGFLS